MSSGDGGIAFWFGTLVGGGVLVLSGTLLLSRRPAIRCVLIVVGCVAGPVPTRWTVVAPFILIALAVAAVIRATAGTKTQTEEQLPHPSGGQRVAPGSARSQSDAEVMSRGAQTRLTDTTTRG